MFNLNKEKQLISKSEILKYFNELEIFQYYIDDEVMLGKLILSPLRRENKASFGFFVGEGNEICFNDFKEKKKQSLKMKSTKFSKANLNVVVIQNSH